MSNELQKSDFYTQLSELDKIQDTCKKLLSTRHYQNLGEAGIHAIMAKAKALGIHPFEALNGGFFCINGRVGMTTEMMAALVRQRGHSIQKDPKSNSECCILHGKRADSGDTWTCSFSKEDAILAGLWNGPTWKKYPAIMLYNRCMSQLFRQLFPDISMGGGYVEDELKEIEKVGEYADKTIDVTPKKPIPEMKKDESIKANLKQETASITLNEKQTTELGSILDQCDPKFVTSFLSHAKNTHGANNLKDLPSHLFDKAKAAALDNRDVYQMRKAELGVGESNE